jgi:hypothetical protein
MSFIKDLVSAAVVATLIALPMALYFAFVMTP